jgi:UDP-galactose transporter
VTYQLKILTTAVLSVVILGKSLGTTKWSALFMLAAGVALIQMPRGPPPEDAAEADLTTTTAPHPEGNALVGLVAVLSACVTSGLAGVYLEKILKQTDASIWLRNIQLAICGSALGLLGAVWQDGAKIQEGGFLQGYNRLVWGVILLQAVGGLVVAAVLKYADNLLKCFGNALSICISCLLSAVLLREFVPDKLFALGTLLVLMATYVYSIGVPEFVRLRCGVKACLPGPDGKPGGDGHGKPAPVPKGSTQGMNGTDLKPLDNISTTWEAGSVQEDPHQADGQGENTRLSDPSDRCQHWHEPQGILLEAQSSPCVQLRFGLPLWQLLQAILDRSRG